MTTALVAANGHTQTVQEWNAEQVKLITDVLSPGLTKQELQLFGQVCHKTGLDPFTRQIYAIKRRQQGVERMTIQTGIDGYRVIAERTGEYVGGDAPVYGPPCQCAVLKATPHPEWAEVTVRRLKDGVPYATSERADFDEYAQHYNGKLGNMWAKMPKRMIAKCAEALALRRAFPGLFEGVYTTEEMAQADSDPPSPAARVIEARSVEAGTTQPPVSPGEGNVPAPSVGADGLESGQREFREGDMCPTCQQLMDETALEVRPGKLRIAKGGPFKGSLQCSGKVGGAWANHPLVVSAADEAHVREMEAAGDIDPDDIPF